MLRPWVLYSGQLVCSVEEDSCSQDKTYIISSNPDVENSEGQLSREIFPEVHISPEFAYLSKEFTLSKLPAKRIHISPFVPSEANFTGLIQLLQQTPDTYKTLMDGKPWSDKELLKVFRRYYKGVGNTISLLRSSIRTGVGFPWNPSFDMCYVVYAYDLDGEKTFIGRCGFRYEQDNAPWGTQVFYAFSPQYWGSGLGKKVGAFLKQQWVQIFNTQRQGYLRGMVQAGKNPASARVLESMGMKRKLDLDGSPVNVKVTEWNDALYSVWEYPLDVLTTEKLKNKLVKEERIRDCANRESKVRIRGMV